MLHRWVCPGFIYEGSTRGKLRTEGYAAGTTPTISVLNPGPAPTTFDARFVDDNGAGIPFHMSGVLAAQSRRSYTMSGGYSVGGVVETSDMDDLLGGPLRKFVYSGWIDIVGYPNPILPGVVTDEFHLSWNGDVESQRSFTDLPVVQVDLTGAPTVNVSQPPGQPMPPPGGTPLPWESHVRVLEYLSTRYSQPLYDIAVNPSRLLPSEEFVEATGLELATLGAPSATVPLLVRLTKTITSEAGVADLDRDLLVEVLGTATAEAIVNALGEGGPAAGDPTRDTPR